MQVRSP